MASPENEVRFSSHCGGRGFGECETVYNWKRTAQRGWQLLDGYREKDDRIAFLRKENPFNQQLTGNDSKDAMTEEQKQAMILGIASLISKKFVDNGMPLVPFSDIEGPPDDVADVAAPVKIVQLSMIDTLVEEVKKAIDNISDSNWRNRFLTFASNDLQCKVGMTQSNKFLGTDTPFTNQVWDNKKWIVLNTEVGYVDADNVGQRLKMKSAEQNKEITIDDGSTKKEVKCRGAAADSKQPKKARKQIWKIGIGHGSGGGDGGGGGGDGGDGDGATACSLIVPTI